MEQNSETKLKELFEAAHQDPVLKMNLLTHPEEVAKEWKIDLGEREITRLKKVGAFLELSNELKAGRVFRCNPKVCYPATVWFKNEAIALLKEYLIFYRKRWIFYPVERKINQRLGLDHISEIQGLNVKG